MLYPFAYRINENIIVNRFNVETFIVYKHVDIDVDSICWLIFLKLKPYSLGDASYANQ